MRSDKIVSFYNSSSTSTSTLTITTTKGGVFKYRDLFCKPVVYSQNGDVRSD